MTTAEKEAPTLHGLVVAFIIDVAKLHRWQIGEVTAWAKRDRFTRIEMVSYCGRIGLAVEVTNGDAHTVAAMWSLDGISVDAHEKIKGLTATIDILSTQ